MAGGTVSRTAHFALHRLALTASDVPVVSAPPSGPGSLLSEQGPQALFGVSGVWLGAMVPKRWARRAVTRNAIKRQIYTVGATFEGHLPQAAHVVRLRTAFDRKQFVSATSDLLKQAVRAELLQLFGQATKRPPGAGAKAVPAAGAQEAAIILGFPECVQGDLTRRAVISAPQVFGLSDSRMGRCGHGWRGSRAVARN